MKIKIDWNHLVNKIIEHVVVIGGLGAIGLAAYLFVLQPKIGLNSYLGLTRQDIQEVARQMDSRCKILSRVHGKDATHEWYRGIYLGGATTFPLYYHYNIYNDGKADYSIYPMVWNELWSTEKDNFGLTGKMEYPTNNGNMVSSEFGYQ